MEARQTENLAVELGVMSNVMPDTIINDWHFFQLEGDNEIENQATKSTFPVLKL